MTNLNNLDHALSALVDDELPQGERAELEAELEADPQAKQTLAQLQALRAHLRGLPDVTAPPKFYDQLSKRILKQRSRDRMARINMLILVLQVVSVFVIVGVAAMLMLHELSRPAALKAIQTPLHAPPSAERP